MENPIKVLLIEDDEEDYEIVDEMLSRIKRTKFTLNWVQDYKSAQKEIDKNEHDIYLLDYRLGIDDGLDLLTYAEKAKCHAPFIVITGQRNHNTDLKAMEMGAYDYLIKGQINSEAIERSIRYALERKKLETKIKNEQNLLSLLINSISVGVCLVHENKIILANDYIYKMFGIKNNIIGIDFDKTFFIKVYNTSVYDNNFKEESKFVVGTKPTVVRVESGKCKKDCLVTMKEFLYKNGVNKKQLIFCFVDITKQKEIEDSLKKTHKQLQDIAEKYGIDNKNPDILMDLIDLEASKIMEEQHVASSS